MTWMLVSLTRSPNREDWNDKYLCDTFLASYVSLEPQVPPHNSRTTRWQMITPGYRDDVLQLQSGTADEHAEWDNLLESFTICTDRLLRRFDPYDFKLRPTLLDVNDPVVLKLANTARTELFTYLKCDGPWLSRSV